MAPTCSNCRRPPPPKNLGVLRNAAIEFGWRRAYTGVPMRIQSYRRSHAPAKKARRSICEAARPHIWGRLPGCCPVLLTVQFRCQTTDPQWVTAPGSANHLPRSHHCHTAQFLLYLLAADLISAWPAPIRQSTPTPPPKVAPATLHHRRNLRHRPNLRHPHVTRGQAEARGSGSFRLQSRTFRSKRTDWRFQSDKSPGTAARSAINPKNRWQAAARKC